MGSFLTRLARYFGIGLLESNLFVLGGFAGREGGFLNSVEENELNDWIPTSFNLHTPRCLNVNRMMATEVVLFKVLTGALYVTTGTIFFGFHHWKHLASQQPHNSHSASLASLAAII